MYAPVTYVRGMGTYMCVLIIATIISSCGTDNQPVLVHFISIDRVPTKEAQQNIIVCMSLSNSTHSANRQRMLTSCGYSQGNAESPRDTKITPCGVVVTLLFNAYLHNISLYGRLSS